MAQCHFCGGAATGACGQCKQAMFCSKECLALAWKHGGHAEVCRLRTACATPVASATYDVLVEDGSTAGNALRSQKEALLRSQRANAARLRAAEATETAKLEIRRKLLATLQTDASKAAAFRQTMGKEWKQLLARVDALSPSERPAQWDSTRAQRAFDGITSASSALWRTVRNPAGAALAGNALVGHMNDFYTVFGAGATTDADAHAAALDAERLRHARFIARTILDQVYEEGLALGLNDMVAPGTPGATWGAPGADFETRADRRPAWMTDSNTADAYDRKTSTLLTQATERIPEKDTSMRDLTRDTRAELASEINTFGRGDPSKPASPSMLQWMRIQSKEILYGILITVLVGVLIVTPGRLVFNAWAAAGEEIGAGLAQMSTLTEVSLDDLDKAKDQLAPVIASLDRKIVAASLDITLASEFIAGKISLAPDADNIKLLGTLMEDFRNATMADLLNVQMKSPAQAGIIFADSFERLFARYEQIKVDSLTQPFSQWRNSWDALNTGLNGIKPFSTSDGVYLTVQEALFAVDSLKNVSKIMEKMGVNLRRLAGVAKTTGERFATFNEQAKQTRTLSGTSTILCSAMGSLFGLESQATARMLWYSYDATLRFQQLEEHFNVAFDGIGSVLQAGGFTDAFTIGVALEVMARTTALLSTMLASGLRLFQLLVSGLEKVLRLAFKKEFPVMGALNEALDRGTLYIEKAATFMSAVSTGHLVFQSILSIVNSLSTIMISWLGYWIAVTVGIGLTVATAYVLVMRGRPEGKIMTFVAWFGRMVIQHHYIISAALASLAFMANQLYGNGAANQSYTPVPVDEAGKYDFASATLADVKMNSRVLEAGLVDANTAFINYKEQVTGLDPYTDSLEEALTWVDRLDTH